MFGCEYGKEKMRVKIEREASDDNKPDSVLPGVITNCIFIGINGMDRMTYWNSNMLFQSQF